jgi:hypothetical protein
MFGPPHAARQERHFVYTLLVGSGEECSSIAQEAGTATYEELKVE